MFIIGVTGGIGSGKTAATDEFNKLGIEIVDADIAARTIVEKGKPALNTIEEKFGSGILLDSGELDRAALREIIFKDPSQRVWLEQLTHPLIREEIIKGLQQAKSPYVILASPLLIESKQYKLVQRTLVIDIPQSLQVERTCNRDNNDTKQVEAIIAAQLSREERLAHADDVIKNDLDLTNLHLQVHELHQAYLDMSIT